MSQKRQPEQAYRPDVGPEHRLEFSESAPNRVDETIMKICINENNQCKNEPNRSLTS